MAQDLKQITLAVNTLIKFDKGVKIAETKLKEEKEKARILREETIPGLMTELGLSSLTLKSGQKLTITQEVYCSISKANQIAAFAWLDKNGHGALIKTVVKTEFGKGENKKAVKCYDQLQKKFGDSVDFKESVHSSTLKAFVKEQLTSGEKFPMDLFGVRPTPTAKIKD